MTIAIQLCLPYLCLCITANRPLFNTPSISPHIHRHDALRSLQQARLLTCLASVIIIAAYLAQSVGSWRWSVWQDQSALCSDQARVPANLVSTTTSSTSSVPQQCDSLILASLLDALDVDERPVSLTPSCLAASSSFAFGRSNSEPTVFENYTHLQSTTSGTPVELTLWDTAGQEEFDKLRSLSYADTHVILLCFSTDNPVSLENVETRWIPEIREYSPGAKIVLVALKCDLRGGNANTLGYQDGVAVAKRIKATRYLECSAKMNRGVNEAFAEIASVAAGVSSDGGRAKMRCVVA